MGSFYVFLITILCLTVFNQLAKSEVIDESTSNFTVEFNTSISYINTTTTANIEYKTNSTSTPSVAYSSTTVILTEVNSSTVTITANETVSATTTSTLPLSLNTTSSNVLTTLDTNNNQPKKSWPKSRWLLITSVAVTIVVLISIIFIYYQRQRRPYRRFLQTWQSPDDDLDNILHMEGPDVSNSQWPHRITLA